MEHKQKAEEALLDTSSFFGLFGAHPNPMLACEEFEKAASKFRANKQYQDAIECYIQNAKLHSEMNSHFLASKGYESAALLLEKHLNQSRKSSEIFSKAANECFLSGSSPDKAAELYLKSALALGNSPDALEKYKEAISLLEDEDRIRFGLEIYTKAFGFCLRNQRFNDAILTSKKMESAFDLIRNSNLYRRQILCSVLIYLKLKDEENAVETWNQGCIKDVDLNTCEEGQVIQELLQAYASCDQESFNEALKATSACKLIPYLDREIVAMVKNGIEVSQTSSNKIASSNANLSSLQDEIEEEGYL